MFEGSEGVTVDVGGGGVEGCRRGLDGCGSGVDVEALWMCKRCGRCVREFKNGFWEVKVGYVRGTRGGGQKRL